MGTAENWQVKLEKYLEPEKGYILNPRRDNWDPKCEQDINNPTFKEQVDWELTGLEKATVIAMYYDPNTKSPISLLETGLFATSGRLMVCCPKGFWRKGNVDIVCKRYKIVEVEEIAILSDMVYRRIRWENRRPK
jgi:hypothetical protein